MQLECTTMDGLFELMKKKNIICWGIGNYFQAFIDSCNGKINLSCISYLIDNNVESHNKKYRIHNKEIMVGSFANYLSCKENNDVIVITTVHYNEIINQILAIDETIDYIVYPLIRHEKKTDDFCIRRNSEMLIPAKIHYCWFGRGTLPAKDQMYIEGWKKLCPEYEIICWNEDNFDTKCNAYVKYAYEHKKWAFVADYVRMYVLYKYGGIYLDTDVELLKNLDDFRYQYAYMGMEESGCVASGLGMGTVAKNPILKEVLEVYDAITLRDIESWSRWKVNADWESNILRKYGFFANNQYQIVQNIAIFPSEFFSPVLVGQNRIDISKNTYSIHHYHYSWLDEEERNTIWNGEK